jgi:Sugar kinases, ribokinase family
VVGIGNALVDLLVRVDDEVLVSSGLLKSTMKLVEDKEAEKILGSLPSQGSPVVSAGGSAATTLVGVASLGGRAGFIGKVDDDERGHQFAASLEGAGVSFIYPIESRSNSGGTGYCLALVTPDGERTMATHLGVSSMLSLSDIDLSAIEAASVCYLEGYLWDQPSFAEEVANEVIEVARGAGNAMALSLSDAQCVQRHRREFIARIADGMDILLSNETEVKALFDVDRLDQAVAELAGYRVTAAVTRGAMGSLVVDAVDGQVMEVIAHPARRVVDTTGAGDLYAAGFLYGLTHGMDVYSSGELGSLCASEAVEHIGGRPRTSLAELARQAGMLGNLRLDDSPRGRSGIPAAEPGTCGAE